jgi:lysylphosphatidylglycerol synthetase-like protein (DUF2156 family)
LLPNYAIFQNKKVVYEKLKTSTTYTTSFFCQLFNIRGCIIAVIGVIPVIAWILIVRSILGLPFLVNYISQSISGTANSITPVLWAVMAVGHIVLGVAILKGLNWGRVVYLCYTPISIVSGVVRFFVLANSSGDANLEIITQVPIFVLEIAFYIVSFIFLTKPAASSFFRSGNSEDE